MEREKKGGYFVISLDFELYWGMVDKVSLDQYGKNIRGVRKAIPRILDVFTAHNIHATWGTLGMLMCRNKEELLGSLPPESQQPRYSDMKLSSYEHIRSFAIGGSEADDPYHFGSSLVEDIIATPGQELASHTFSHYYCIDGNKNSETTFAADCAAEAAIFKSYHQTPTSIIFPRNQTTEEALRTCKAHGITAYRGNENHFLYKARSDESQSLPIRALRLLDHYINISGHHTAPLSAHTNAPINIPASRFLRPFSKKLKMFESLRMRRIKKSMTHAARNGHIFHLWWHPHNFGTNLEENMKNLNTLLAHFETLKKTFDMESKNMRELTTNILSFKTEESE